MKRPDYSDTVRIVLASGAKECGVDLYGGPYRGAATIDWLHEIVNAARDEGRQDGLTQAISICGQWYADQSRMARINGGDSKYEHGQDIVSAIEDEIRELMGVL